MRTPILVVMSGQHRIRYHPAKRGRTVAGEDTQELSRIDWRNKRLGKLLIDGSLTCGKQQARVADQDKKQDITGK
jgi:hypothetical protein